jgi:hypothetical protein
MSLVLGHFMRHVMVTPIPKEIDLVNTLRELRFEEIIRTFGIFYMDISLKTLFCLQIPKQDSPYLVHVFKTPFITTSDNKAAPLALIPSQLSHQYPWGYSIQINQLQELIDTSPSQFLKPPSFLSEDDMQHPDSAGIFRYFSKDIWLLAREDLHQTSSNLDISDLTSAMKIWTTRQLKIHCHHVVLLPTFDRIEVDGKLPKTSFLGRRSFFFPEEKEIGTHPCHAYLSSQTSYLSLYYKAVKQGEDSQRRINQDLDRIFSLLQCLPASIKKKQKIVIWQSGTERSLQFVINSAFYHVGRVTPSRPYQDPSSRRVQLTQPMLKKMLNPRL